MTDAGVGRPPSVEEVLVDEPEMFRYIVWVRPFLSNFVNGTGFPIGPFKLGDFKGLDMALDVLLYVHEQLSAAYYTPPRVLNELVHAGKLGQKTGEGFYDYPEGG